MTPFIEVDHLFQVLYLEPVFYVKTQRIQDSHGLIRTVNAERPVVTLCLTDKAESHKVHGNVHEPWDVGQAAWISATVANEDRMALPSSCFETATFQTEYPRGRTTRWREGAYETCH